MHFAQINARDGFLIASRQPDAAFSWEKLLSGPFMFVHGGQPQAMLAYAMHKRGVDLTKVQSVNAGASETMMAAWRTGQGEYFHEQGPYPQQIEHEGWRISWPRWVGPRASGVQQPDGDPYLAADARGTPLHAGLPQGTRVGTAPAAEIAQAEQALFLR